MQRERHSDGFHGSAALFARLELLKECGFPLTGATVAGDGRRVVVATLPYAVDDGEEPGLRGAGIECFARHNYYREAVIRLKRWVALLLKKDAPGLKKSDFRIFCNSPLPEREWAAAAGLGFVGRHSLLITEKFGSRCVIAGALCPESWGGWEQAVPTPPAPVSVTVPVKNCCGSCRRCVDACPGGAIGMDGSFRKEGCLQHLALQPSVPPWAMEKWGNRLYGCGICQKVCPHNPTRQEGAGCRIGVLPPEIPFQTLFGGDDALKELLRRSALGMGWIDRDLLRRNGLLSLPSVWRFLPQGERMKLEKLVLRFFSDETPALRDAARFVISRLRKA